VIARTIGALFIFGVLVNWPAATLAGGNEADKTPEAAMEQAPEFTEAFLNDPVNFKAGMEVWQLQCRHCHGSSAYPGKAPKLKPRRYTPDFVFDRVTNGFRKMPGWKAVFSREQRMTVVAYVLSSNFSP